MWLCFVALRFGWVIEELLSPRSPMPSLCNRVVGDCGDVCSCRAEIFFCLAIGFHIEDLEKVSFSKPVVDSSITPSEDIFKSFKFGNISSPRIKNLAAALFTLISAAACSC